MNDNVTGDSRRSHRWDVEPSGHQVFPLPPQNNSFLLKSLSAALGRKGLQNSLCSS